MQLYRKIKIIKKTEPLTWANVSLVYDEGDICQIVPQDKQEREHFRITVPLATFLVDKGFAEFIDPTEVEQAPDVDARPSRWTRAQIDADLDMLTVALRDWNHEKALRARLDEGAAAVDALWGKMSEKDVEAIEAHIALLELPFTESRQQPLLSVMKDLAPLVSAYRLAAKAQIVLRKDWEAYQSEVAQSREDELLAKMAYVESLIPSDAQDAADDPKTPLVGEPWTPGERATARKMFAEEYATIKGSDWNATSVSVKQFWLWEARQYLESEKTNGE